MLDLREDDINTQDDIVELDYCSLYIQIKKPVVVSLGICTSFDFPVASVWTLL